MNKLTSFDIAAAKRIKVKYIKTKPPKNHYLVFGTSGQAVFEHDGNQLVVSATLGFATMLYRRTMSREDAVKLWHQLVHGRGAKVISQIEARKRNVSHESVYNFYR